MWLRGAVLFLALGGWACGGVDEPGGFVPGLAEDVSVTGIVGFDGGTFETSHAGVSFRVVIPAGALIEETVVTVTPFSGIEGLPLSGGLIAGVHLEPSGLRFLLPVTVELHLDSPHVDQIREAVDSGMVVHGFSYLEDGEELAADLVEVSDGFSVVRLSTLSFSGHGAGIGDLEDLKTFGVPTDASRAAVQEINRLVSEDTRRWLQDPDGDESYFGPVDNAVLREDIAQVIFDLFNDHVEPLTVDAMTDASKFDDAFNAALDWLAIATKYKFVSGGWGISTDEFGDEADQLKRNLQVALKEALLDANEKCEATGDLKHVSRIMKLDTAASKAELIESQLATILTPEGFCLKFEISVAERPEWLVAGESATVSFTVKSQAGLVPDVDLKALNSDGRFVSSDRYTLLATTEKMEAFIGMEDFSTDLISGSPGNKTATVTLELEFAVHGYVLATHPLKIDVAPPPITCGEPVTITETQTIDIEVIWVTFDGTSNCEVHGEFEDQDVRMEDFPDAVIAVDIDRDNAGWDDEGIGSNWTRDRYGDDVAPGTYTLLVTHTETGNTFTMRFTVQITDSSASSVTMTVGDVSFTPVAP